jgi:hypothetical protein
VELEVQAIPSSLMQDVHVSATLDQESVHKDNAPTENLLGIVLVAQQRPLMAKLDKDNNETEAGVSGCLHNQPGRLSAASINTESTFAQCKLGNCIHLPMSCSCRTGC